MTTLDQLAFQKYNERLGGPSIPLGKISFATLREMPRGLHYDYNRTGHAPVEIDWGSDTETFPHELIEEEERQLQLLKEQPAKQKEEPSEEEQKEEPIEEQPKPAPKKNKRKLGDIEYEITNEGTRVATFDTKEQAFEYLDDNSLDGAQIYKNVRTEIKRRKVAKKSASPRPPKAAAPRETLRSLGITDFGDFIPVLGSLDASGKRNCTWWIYSKFALCDTSTSAEIREAAKYIRKVPACTAIEWAKHHCIDAELRTWPLFIDDDTNREKINGMTARLRKMIKAVCTKPAAPSSDDVLHASV